MVADDESEETSGDLCHSTEVSVVWSDTGRELLGRRDPS